MGGKLLSVGAGYGARKSEIARDAMTSFGAGCCNGCCNDKIQIGAPLSLIS
jgi:hypothetical protein